MQPYTDTYYEQLNPGALQSARVVVPLVCAMIRPSSVVDVGCGQGVWLAAFQEHGVRDVQGLDGDYVSRERLAMEANAFRAIDLTRPISLGRRFDLVVSLEVAEHLPAACAGDFVDSLTRLGPVVLFSAAIPHQGGAEHVNEQWPAYWADLFSRKDYVLVDCLRRRLWANLKVDWWYAQNSVLYVARGHLEMHPVLRAEYEVAGPEALALVHPRRYLEWVEWGLSQQRRSELLADALGAASNDGAKA